jgi:hypothetical protein
MKRPAKKTSKLQTRPKERSSTAGRVGSHVELQSNPVIIARLNNENKQIKVYEKA